MRYALMIMMVFALVGCGAAASPAGTGGTGTSETVTPGAPALPAGSVEATVAQALAQQSGADVDGLQLTDKVAQEWSDSSLGCPDPATMYMQVITPGYKLTFSDGSKTYEVHTNEAGTNAVLCENGTPTVLP
jgi:hypothetical protein